MDATHGAYGSGQLPLAGAILCCTAISPEQRAHLAGIATQMGAAIKLDLTSDVTHLIVGSTDSAKYRYVAKCREDVKVLAPAWLEALRHVWLEGEDELDVSGLENTHRLPTFFGLKICLTGFDDQKRRYIQETVTQNGAEYHGDLTKIVTHLIVANPSGKKYEHALTWKMKVVSLEWLEQSLERGMVLDEGRYNPTMPVEERGKGAWDRLQARTPVIGKRTRDVEQAQALNPLKRKLRRSASTKFGTQSDALWAGITSVGFTPDKNGEDDWKEDAPQQSTPGESAPAVRANDLPPHHANIESEAHTAVEHANGNAALSNTGAHAGIFQGHVVVPYAFDQEKTAILREHLQNNGAHVLTIDELDSVSGDNLYEGFLVLPHDTNVDVASGSLPERAGNLTLVTNWWVERCLYGRSLVDPRKDVLSRPFNKICISGFSGLIVNSTGYSGIELLHVTKAVTLMGAVYDEVLSAKTSVIVCNTYKPAQPKMKFAADRHIPVVHAAWLEDSLSRGELQPYDAYMLNKSAQPLAHPQKPGQNANPPSAPSDTSIGSRRENPQLQQKKAQGQKMIAKPKGPPQPRALDMVLPDANLEYADSFGHLNDSVVFSDAGQNDHSIGGLDGSLWLPLQDRVLSDRNANTNARQRSSSAESLIRAAPAAQNPHSVNEPTNYTVPQQLPEGAEGEKDYSDILAQLRANRKAAPTPTDQAEEKRRKRKLLGRAPSTRSNQSMTEGSGSLDLNDAEDENSVLIPEYQPSQELGWDSPGAAKAREQMIKKLGGTVKERSVPAEGIGVVKDAVNESGLGRASRRRG